MAYPPSVPAGTRINTTPQVNTHPTDHNTIHAALTDIINELGSNPSGDYADLTTNLAVVCPLGAVLPYAGATAPTGWALCNGAAVSRTTYAELFALIGTTYGAGDTTTTFNLPDLRSRFVAGKGTATWSDALNESGGSKDAVAVAHTHTSTDHQHTWSGTTSGESGHNHPGSGNGFVYWDTSYGTNQSATTPVGPNTPWALSWQVNTGASSGHTHTYSGTTSGAVGGTGNTTASQSPTATGTDQNLPPYLTLNHIIRLT